MIATAPLMKDPESHLEESLRYIQLIEEIAKRASELGLHQSGINTIRQVIKSKKRTRMRVQLSSPPTKQDFERALRWVDAKGSDVELGLLAQIIQAPPFRTDLVRIVFRSVSQRVYNAGTAAAAALQPEVTMTYAVFCPEQEIQNLPQGVHIIEQYAAFSVISGPDNSIFELRKRYPVRVLAKSGPTNPGPVSPGGVVQSSRQFTTLGVAVMRNHIVRFTAPIREHWKRHLEEAGARILQPVGGSALIVSTTSETLERVGRLEEVSSIEPFVPELRIRPDFISGLGQRATEDTIAEAWQKAAANASNNGPGGLSLPGVFVANFFTKEDCDEAQKVLEEQGVQVLDRPSETRLVLRLSSTDDPMNDLAKVATRTGLSSLEEKTIETPSNDVARDAIGQGVVFSVPSVPGALSLTGKGEVIAIADTGLDTGMSSTLHLDFQNRVRAIKSYPIRASLSQDVTNPGHDDGPADQYSGHGTHVAGSALGSGEFAEVLGLPRIQGVAPEAELIFQAMEQVPKWTLQAIQDFLNVGIQPPPHGLFGIPDNLEEVFRFAYQSGARIHSNSWGSEKRGEYTSQSKDVDRFVWEHRDFLILVAAGNSAVQKSSTIDLMSVGAPGTAKNCLTVGACENARPGQFPDTYGQWWPNEFPNDPFKSKAMVDSIDDIAAFSSRGPSMTGRQKPDVVAPGTFVLSARSSQMAKNNFAWGAFPPAKGQYMYMGGTSMATPLVAGCAALVRQYLREQVGIPAPSAALIKASLIHSAEYLNYRYCHASSSPFADFEQGWGRISLKSILAPSSPRQVVFIDEPQSLSTGESREYTVVVTNDTVQLRATLVYTDFPDENLVNNLNLLIFDPSGKYYVGNDFDGAGNPDTSNNVEGVFVDSPATGQWTIRVVAWEVQQGPQEFALVVSGGGLTLR